MGLNVPPAIGIAVAIVAFLACHKVPVARWRDIFKKGFELDFAFLILGALLFKVNLEAGGAVASVVDFFTTIHAPAPVVIFFLPFVVAFLNRRDRADRGHDLSVFAALDRHGRRGQNRTGDPGIFRCNLWPVAHPSASVPGPVLHLFREFIRKDCSPITDPCGVCGGCRCTYGPVFRLMDKPIHGVSKKKQNYVLNDVGALI